MILKSLKLHKHLMENPTHKYIPTTKNYKRLNIRKSTKIKSENPRQKESTVNLFHRCFGKIFCENCQFENGIIHSKTLSKKYKPSEIKSDCLFCLNIRESQKIPEYNDSIEFLSPLAAQCLDKHLNNGIKAFEIISKSMHPFQWQCPNFQTTSHPPFFMRTCEFTKALLKKGRHGYTIPCPYCMAEHFKSKPRYSKILPLDPDVCKTQHPTKNFGINVKMIVSSMRRSVQQRCNSNSNHTYFSSIRSCLNKDKKVSNCPRCCFNSYETNRQSLAVKFPTIAKEWHPTKNLDFLPSNIGPGSNIKVQQQCPLNSEHSWLASPESRLYKGNTYNCPYCGVQEKRKRKVLLRLGLL